VDDMLTYVKIDESKARADLEEVEAEIKALEAQVDDLKQRKAMLNRVVAMAAGDLDVGALTKSKARGRARTQSVDPQQIVDHIKSNGGKATLDELKDALGVGGRVIGGALRKDDRLKKDASGNYVTKA